MPFGESSFEHEHASAGSNRLSRYAWQTRTPRFDREARGPTGWSRDRFVLKGPDGRHRTGGLYEVSIHLALPNAREVNVGRSPQTDERQADLWLSSCARKSNLRPVLDRSAARPAARRFLQNRSPRSVISSGDRGVRLWRQPSRRVLRRTYHFISDRIVERDPRFSQLRCECGAELLSQAPDQGIAERDQV
jgi:hypothetical protein